MARVSVSRAMCALLLMVLPPAAAQETLAHAARSSSPAERVAIEPGSGSFVVPGGGGYGEKRITVFYHRPESLHPGSRVMVVIPGAGRNGDDYRDAWVAASETYGVLILSPSYSEQFYPEFWSYNLAGMTSEVTLDVRIVVDTTPDEWALDDAENELASIGMHDLVGSGPAHQHVYQLALLGKAGMLAGMDLQGTSPVVNMNPDDWIFGDFDRIFEGAREALGLEAARYDLFGHSAGGQILHRFALFHTGGRADRILAANSGWYTVPTFEQEFPYGLKRTGMSEDQLGAAFATELIVFLGQEDDEDETRGSLRRTPEADRQGAHRLARGRYFFRNARHTAEQLGADFRWKMVTVAGVGHDYKRMSQAAAEYLYGGNAAN